MRSFDGPVLYLFAAFSVTLAGPGTTSADMAKSVNGFKLVQKSLSAGILDVHTCAQGTRIQTARNGLIFITRQDSSRVTVVNPKAKTFCTVPIAGWKPPQSLINLIRSDGFLDLRVDKTESTKQNGLKAELKILKTNRSLSAAPKNHREAIIVTDAKVVVTRDLRADPGSWRVCCELAGLPDLGGYPLSETCTNRLHQERRDFHTQSVEPGKFDLAELDVPKDYKQLAKLDDVYSETSGIDALKEMVENY